MDALESIAALATANRPVAVAVTDRVAVFAVDGRPGLSMAIDDFSDAVRVLEEAGVRWVWWSNETAAAMIEAGVHPARCWDLAAVHRLLAGGWASDPGHVWAHVNGLDVETIPTVLPVDLFTQGEERGDPDQPIGNDGHVRPEWVEGAWAAHPDRAMRWVELAIEVQRRQANAVAQVDREHHAGVARGPGHVRATALSESAAEVICAELEHVGLPFDRTVGEQIVAGFVGRRPSDDADERTLLRELDDTVLCHLPAGTDFDLRRPDHVKSLLRRVGIEVPDTRAWRLEALRDAHPIVAPLLAWRRAERIRTTFGYAWLDEHVGTDGRLRGRWHGSDGAAGRMTATAGLHNMPAEMRPAVVAPRGRLLVRADLGQIEPRILAAVSGDRQLIRACRDDDLYAPVASRLRVERSVAKVAVLGAMYGQTTGIGAEALHGLEREYPVAMEYLRRADEAAQGGNDLRTYGGRRLRMSAAKPDPTGSDGHVRSKAAARGRYGRNAVVQGAAAEFFKTWAALVRARGAEIDARIVLCLHDELLIDAAADDAATSSTLIVSCLAETAHRWSPPAAERVRFVVDVSTVERWSDAK